MPSETWTTTTSTIAVGELCCQAEFAGDRLEEVDIEADNAALGAFELGRGVGHVGADPQLAGCCDLWR
jgi:hypothetical protein